MNLDNEKLNDIIIESIQEKKGIDVCLIDLTHLEQPIASYFIICSGNTDRQTKAIGEYILENIKKQRKELPFSREGLQKGEWILLDYVTTVVHVFLPSVRSYYNLEELWGDGEITMISDDPSNESIVKKEVYED